MADLNRFIKNGNYYYFGDAPIHISGLSLNKSSISLTTVGQTEQLTATISPQGAVETKVVWSSSDESIATVSQTGLVTCVTPGECVITANCGGYSASCSVVERKDVYADFLLVGGGGGGGGSRDLYVGGGGGGGGGIVYCSNYKINSGSYSINIGSGGTGGFCINGGNPGCVSKFSTLSAYGGGGGGGLNTNGYAGGSGGGGGGTNGSCVTTGGGVVIAGQGNAGGGSCCYWGGGGGGGKAGVGGNAQNLCLGGNGANGCYSNISGAYVWYGGGGGGGSFSNCTHGTGGSGGGTLAPTCYGGGGGGGQYRCNSYYGYDGCQGIFIIRYLTACGYDVTGGTKYTCGNYTIHCFTSNGTLTVN